MDTDRKDNLDDDMEDEDDYDVDRQRVLVFTSLIEPPFLERKYNNVSHNEVLVGFIPDLVRKIASRLQMPYRLKLVAEGGYGVLKADGTWNGMLGEVINGEADIAAGALSIQPWRSKVVDFTKPFMEVGIGTVLLKPPGNKDPPFSSPKELANQNDIQYGLIPGTLTQHFFRTTNDTMLQKMWNTMYTARPSVFEWTSSKGIARVRESNGKYVFFIESAFAEFLTNQKPCDLMMLNELLNPKDYAFAVQKGSPLLRRINKAMRTLFNEGIIDRLHQKYWRGRCSRGRRRGKSRDRFRNTKVADANTEYRPREKNRKEYREREREREPKKEVEPVKGWTRNAPRRLSSASHISCSLASLTLCIFVYILMKYV